MTRIGSPDSLSRVLSSERLPLLPPNEQDPEVERWRRDMYVYLNRIAGLFTEQNLRSVTEQGVDSGSWFQGDVTGNCLNIGKCGDLAASIGAGSLNRITLMFWVRKENEIGGSSYASTIFGWEDTETSGQKGGLQVEIVDGGGSDWYVRIDSLYNASTRKRGQNSTATTPNDGDWHSVWVEMQVDTTVGIEIFIDGVSKTVTTSTPSTVGYTADAWNQSLDIYIGQRNVDGTPTDTCVLWLDEVTIWIGGSFPATIPADYHAAGRSCPRSYRRMIRDVIHPTYFDPAWAHYGMDALESGEGEPDRSGNGRNGVYSTTGDSFFGLPGIF